MVSRSADDYYRYEYDIQGGGYTPPDDAIRYYIKLFTRDRDALRASFGLYRAWDDTVAQNGARADDQLTMPVLAIGGGNSWGRSSPGSAWPTRPTTCRPSSSRTQVTGSPSRHPTRCSPPSPPSSPRTSRRPERTSTSSVGRAFMPPSATSR